MGKHLICTPYTVGAQYGNEGIQVCSGGPWYIHIMTWMLLSRGKFVLQLLSNTLLLLQTLVLACAETCSPRDAGAPCSSEMGLEFKGTARTDGDPEVIF